MTRAIRLALLLAAALAGSAAGAFALSAEDIYPLREVRPGQRALAKSVFRGTRIESFHLEIVGVLDKYDGTRSIILGRVLDGPVVERKCGVLAGMSGSPVYIGGRLAGAIALSWQWSKEPIAGITPIAEMLEAWEGKRTGVEIAAGHDAGPRPELRVNGEVIGHVRVAPMPTAAPDPAGVITLVPLGGLVQVSGFNSRSVERLSEVLTPYGLRMVQGPAGAGRQKSPPLAPGAALGVRLVGGDFDMTALGTVTIIDGPRVLAFGHPLFQRGKVDLPMTGGLVHDILPSRLISSKIMSPTQVVGRIYSDHQVAVAGEIGPRADLLPVTVRVEDTDFRRSRTFELEVVRLREIMPALIASCVLTSIDETRSRIARATSRVSVEIQAEGWPTIHREDLVYGDVDGAAAALSPVLAPLTAFTDSPYGKLEFKRVDIRVQSEEVRRTASIERVTVAQSRVKAGDTVRLDVTLRPYGEHPVQVPMELALPPDLPRGQMRLVVAAGHEAPRARSAIGAPIPGPVSLEQVIRRYTSRENSNQLVLQAALTRAGVSMLGEEFPDLPRSVLDALRAVSPTDLRPLPSVAKVVVPTEWVLSGRQLLVLNVQSAIAPGPPAPPRPPAERPPGKKPEKAAFANDVAPVPLAAAGLEPPPAVALAAPGPGKKPDGKEEPKPLTRAPEAWSHSTSYDYVQAKLRGIAVDKDGRLSLTIPSEQLAAVPAEVVWAVAAREGVAYIGTGSGGRIYRASSDGELSEYFATGETHVHALHLDPEGNLYAGTSPRGRLYRVAPDGAGTLLHDSDSVYLWCLAGAPDGTLYVGGGPPARIYAISPEGEARVVAELPAANVLSLALSGSGELYAGTSAGGLVYRVQPDGAAQVVCQVSGRSVDALLLDEDGNLYASASPGGDIWRVPAKGVPVLHCETEQSVIYGMALLPDGDLVAATGPAGILVRVGGDGRPQIMFRPETGVATALADADGLLYVGASAPSTLRRFQVEGPVSGTLESAVLDGGRPARWGRVTRVGRVPEGAEATVETRSGNSPDPEDHWSPWEPAADRAIVSPAARYLQYRLTLTAETLEAAPVIQEVHVSYRPQNRPPVCQIKDPKPDQALSEKHTLKWQARDPDKDDLVYDAAISSDLGETWDDLETQITEAKYEWDTSDKEDGQYLLRVTASDGQSVPDDPRTAEATTLVWVDNTAPELVLFRTSVNVGDDRRARVAGMATDALSSVRSVEYRVDDGKWRSVPLAALDGSLTDLAIVTDPLEPGDHKLEVRAFDAAGNHAADSVSVTVEKGEAEETTGERAEAKAEEPAGGEEAAAEPAAEQERAGEEASRAVPEASAE